MRNIKKNDCDITLTIYTVVHKIWGLYCVNVLHWPYIQLYIRYGVYIVWTYYFRMYLVYLHCPVSCSFLLLVTWYCCSVSFVLLDILSYFYIVFLLMVNVISPYTRLKYDKMEYWWYKNEKKIYRQWLSRDYIDSLYKIFKGTSQFCVDLSNVKERRTMHTGCIASIRCDRKMAHN